MSVAFKKSVASVNLQFVENAFQTLVLHFVRNKAIDRISKRR